MTSSRTILLRYLPIIAALCVDVFFLAMLDTLFVSKKRALIIDSQEQFQEILDIVKPFQLDISKLNPSFGGYEIRAQDFLEHNAEAFLQGEHPWYRIVLTDGKGTALFERENAEKFHRYNNASNSLFSQTFSAPYGSPVSHITIFFASPLGWKSLEAMVVNYWIYASLFVLATWVAFFALSRSVFQPLLHIHDAIERIIQRDRNALIVQPKHDIEDAFNLLVRNQREVFFGFEIDQLIDRLHSISDDREALLQYLEKIGGCIQRVYPAKSVTVYWRPPGGDALVSLDAESQEIPMNRAPQSHEVECGRSALSIPIVLGGDLISQINIAIDQSKRQPDGEWLRIGKEIQKQAENGLARSLSRSRTLTEERNRFGINLATNMGHDLTNIIASGKWDLDTIHRAHSLGIVKMEAERGRFFLDAVTGLRNNLHFLQQMVDIYRSFGYTQSPRFEPANIVELVKDISNLYRLSSSQKLSIEVDGEGGIQAVVEPRLLRMMLFNLLANAAQAIVRAQPPIQDGRIHLKVRREPEGRFRIVVQDNGPGIRDSDGNPLSGHEIHRIFTSGYTTKGKSSGGGLGLSWVKSIVENFHAGTITASNRPERGAEMIITIPVSARESEGQPE